MKKIKTTLRKPFLHRIAKLFESYTVEKKDHFYQHFFTLLKEIVHFQNASIFFYNQHSKQLELVAFSGEVVDLIQSVEFDLGSGLSAWLAKEQKFLLLNNIDKKEDTLNEKHIKSFLCIPLILDEKLFGIINFSHHKSNAFSKESLPYMKVAAPFIAAMLSQNHYINTLQKQKEEIKSINQKLKKAHEKLITLEKKEAISATVCSLNHEINNPLMIISGNIQLLIASEEDPQKQKKLNDIEEQITRISSIMSQLREIESPLFEQYIQDGKYDKILKIKPHKG